MNFGSTNCRTLLHTTRNIPTYMPTYYIGHMKQCAVLPEHKFFPIYKKERTHENI